MTHRLSITPGEPAGIGPDIVIMQAQKASTIERVVIADPELMRARAKTLGLPLKIKLFKADEPAVASGATELSIEPINLVKPCITGTLDKANAAYVIATLDRACKLNQSSSLQGLVTGPVQKSVINQAGLPFSGHTEYLAEKTQTPLVVMMLAADAFRVALVTTHLPLKQVPNAITRERLTDTLRIIHRDLVNTFGITEPRIVVCGLNPHAGEQGHLGDEEITTIIPVMDALSKELLLTGPLPADTAFTPNILNQADVVVAMYHDQGLPVLKSHGFGRAVNITLGLPFIRTSVDHGTALGLAGTGKANPDSLQCAIDSAISMAHTQ